MRTTASRMTISMTARLNGMSSDALPSCEIMNGTGMIDGFRRSDVYSSSPMTAKAAMERAKHVTDRTAATKPAMMYAARQTRMA